MELSEPWRNPLLHEFVRLKTESDGAARGRMFEGLVQRLFVHSRYRVDRNVGAARPRQTDLFATYGEHRYLIEVKWRRDRADINDIDSLASRLNRTAGSVIGILFSMAGFSREALEHVKQNRQRIMLLFDGDEITKLFERRLSLHRLIARKEEALLKDGQVLFAADARRWQGRQNPKRADLPAPDFSIRDSTETAPWIVGRGNFNSVIFVQDLPDVDWTTAQGFGVALDLTLDVERQEDLAYVLDIFNGLGWVSSSGRFSIQQSELNWHGAGAAGFLEALDQRKDRYADTGHTRHHAETAAYFDLCEGGFYTLVVELDARDGAPRAREVYRASLSAQLPGIPLDLEPFRRLGQELDLDTQMYFRPLAGRVVRRAWNLPRAGLGLTAMAALLDESQEWVVGIVAHNPFYRHTDAPALHRLDEVDLRCALADSETLVCGLGSWHRADNSIGSYYLRGLEATRTADATVFHVAAGWNAGTRESPRRRRAGRRGTTRHQAKPQTGVEEVAWRIIES